MQPAIPSPGTAQGHTTLDRPTPFHSQSWRRRCGAVSGRSGVAAAKSSTSRGAEQLHSRRLAARRMRAPWPMQASGPRLAASYSDAMNWINESSSRPLTRIRPPGSDK
jgi:hypothetical protein